MAVPYAHVERTIDIGSRQMIIFNTGHSVFSNYYLSPIQTAPGRVYRTAEHFYQTWKAAYFDDREKWEAILAEPRPGKARHLSRSIKNFDKDVWKVVAPIVMQQVVLLKFQQNQQAREKLLQTGDAMLVAATEFDHFWASGLDIMNDSHKDIQAWRGTNVLGSILMDVREELRNSWCLCCVDAIN